MATAGGIVFLTGDDLWFLPATVAAEVLPVPEVARIPGAPPDLLGVAVHAGEAIPVVAVGSSRSCMLVCSYLGERLGLVGIEVLATGRFEVAAEESLHGEAVLAPASGPNSAPESRRARPFDVSQIIATIRGERWAASRP
jgi:hypothetical protein